MSRQVATINGQDEWLLVEAKAHIGEMQSDCEATEKGGLLTIRSTLADLKRDLGVPAERDWLVRYYQVANRLAILNLLTRNKAPARLLFIYFVGDKARHVSVVSEVDHFTAPDATTARRTPIELQPSHDV